MLISVLADIRNALLADSTLVSLLGGKKIYSVLSPDGTKVPYIVVSEVGNEPTEYGDNAPTRSYVSVQVNIVSKTDYTDIAAEVDSVLTSAGYTRTNALDLPFDANARVFQKSLRYWIAKEMS